MGVNETTAEQRRDTLFESDEFEWSAGLHEITTFAPRAVRRRRMTSVLVASDSVMLLFAIFLATFVRFGNLNADVMAGWGFVGPGYVQLSLGVAAALLVCMFIERLYDVDRLGWGSAEFTRIARSLAIGVVGAIVALYAMGMPYLSREWAVLVWVFGFALVASGRLLLRLVASRIVRRGGWLQRPTLVVGSNVEAAEVVRILRSDPGSGLVPVGCLASSLKDKLSFDYCAPLVPTLGTARSLAQVVTEQGIDTVVIVASAFDYEVLQRMIRELRDLPISTKISSALSDVLSTRVLIREVSGIPLILLRGVSLSPAKVATKRAFDLVIGGLIVLLGMPLWAVIALLIKVTSNGPVFYRQERIGRNGKPFQMYKFRSMTVDAEDRLSELQVANQADGPLFKIREDPRVTSLGAWMRKFSVDEFPQLINVLRGEMSLVGPRPPLEIETLQYTEWEWRRLEAAPGMTGLWQVSGRSRLTFSEMVRLDVFYIDNWSVGLDLALIARTLPAVLLARGAY